MESFLEGNTTKLSKPLKNRIPAKKTSLLGSSMESFLEGNTTKLSKPLENRIPRHGCQRFDSGFNCTANLMIPSKDFVHHITGALEKIP